mgnify:CR=1 FL=1
MTKNSNLWRGLSATMALVLCLASFGTQLAFTREGDVNLFLDTRPPVIAGTDDTTYFKSDYATKDEMLEAQKAYLIQCQTEGSVLLRSNLQSNITAGSVKLTGCTLIGDITANGPVTVSEDSKVTGNITAQSLLCAGEINGDIRISGNTQMDANARVSGSVVTGTISVAAGAVLNGSVEMKGTMEAKS